MGSSSNVAVNLKGGVEVNHLVGDPPETRKSPVSLLLSQWWRRLELATSNGTPTWQWPTSRSTELRFRKLSSAFWIQPPYRVHQTIQAAFVVSLERSERIRIISAPKHRDTNERFISMAKNEFDLRNYDWSKAERGKYLSRAKRSLGTLTIDKSVVDILLTTCP